VAGRADLGGHGSSRPTVPRLGIEPTVIGGGHLVTLADPEGLADVLLHATD
jgi:hypothetical protein